MAGIDEGQGQIAHRPRPRRSARLGGRGRAVVHGLADREGEQPRSRSERGRGNRRRRRGGRRKRRLRGVDWGYWQGVNPDIIGWVTVPGAGIDYPIVQAHEGDPDHYLRYDVYGGWNYHGVPYLHWKCADVGLLGAGNAWCSATISTTARCSPRWRVSRTPITRRGIPDHPQTP